MYLVEKKSKKFLIRQKTKTSINFTYYTMMVQNLKSIPQSSTILCTNHDINVVVDSVNSKKKRIR